MSTHDFDFLFGNWRVHNRRLTRRLEGSQDWEEFETHAEIRPVLGGHSNVEEITRAGGEPLGLTIRNFNRVTREWHLSWVGAQDGIMQPPMVGTFDGENSQGKTGTFYGPDVWQGRPCVCRFQWRVHRDGHAGWDQAFSGDDGQTWETNWTMDFTRQGTST